MSQSIDLRSWHCRIFLPALMLAGMLSGMLVGCAKPDPTRSLAGTWHGTFAAGNVAVPSQWEFRPDGTQSVTLTLPQGSLSQRGTFLVRDGVLTQRTTARSTVIGGVSKAVSLSSPIEAQFEYQLADITLTLTQVDKPQKIVLTRDKSSR